MVDIIQKTRDDYNKIAPNFSQTREQLWPEFNYFRRFIKPGQNILDWGCGNGRLLLLLKNKTVRYFGVDISEELLKIARRLWRPAIQAGWAKFFWVGKRQKHFAADFFDCIFMVASFHHLPDETHRLRVLGEMRRVLRPGGKLILTVWNLSSDWARNKARFGWQAVSDGYLVPYKNNKGEVLAERYYHAFSVVELKTLLQRAGFKVNKLDFFQETSRGSRNIIAVATKPKNLP